MYMEMGWVMKKIREMADAFNPEGEILRDYLGLREVSPLRRFPWEITG